MLAPVLEKDRERGVRRVSRSGVPGSGRFDPAFRRPGGALLSHDLRRSTIGAEGFHGRVRDGIGCWGPRYGHQVVEASDRVLEELPGAAADGRLSVFRPSKPVIVETARLLDPAFSGLRVCLVSVALGWPVRAWCVRLVRCVCFACLVCVFEEPIGVGLRDELSVDRYARRGGRCLSSGAV